MKILSKLAIPIVQAVLIAGCSSSNYENCTGTGKKAEEVAPAQVGAKAAREKRRFAFIGVFGQMIFVDPELKLVMVQTAAEAVSHPAPLAKDALAL